jgi:FixJ family two-component response regulator
MTKNQKTGGNGNGKGHAPVIGLVDDDASVRSAVSTLLRSVGFDCRDFASGAEFLLSGLASTADCLIVDLRMKGMSGLELQETLVQAGVKLPMVFISAHGDVDARARAASAGALGFLSKPFEERALLDCVRAALASRP